MVFGGLSISFLEEIWIIFSEGTVSNKSLLNGLRTISKLSLKYCEGVVWKIILNKLKDKFSKLILVVGWFHPKVYCQMAKEIEIKFVV